MFNAIRYDLRFGIYEARQKYLLIVFFGAFVFLCFVFDAVHMSVMFTGDTSHIKNMSLSIGDAILLELGSDLPNSATGQMRLAFPTMWFLLNILPLYITLKYTTHDLSGCGIQVLTRLRSKITWWCSKCVLSTVSVVVYFVIIYVTMITLCFVGNFELSLIPDEVVFATQFNAIFLAKDVTEFQMFLSLCVMPCVVAAALSLMQMTLTLFVQPMLAYIVVCAYTAASVLCVYPAFIGNFAMPVRSATVGIYHFNSASGFIYSAVVAMVAIIVGAIRISKMDIIQGETA